MSFEPKIWTSIFIYVLPLEHCALVSFQWLSIAWREKKKCFVHTFANYCWLCQTPLRQNSVLIANKVRKDHFMPSFFLSVSWNLKFCSISYSARFYSIKMVTFAFFTLNFVAIACIDGDYEKFHYRQVFTSRKKMSSVQNNTTRHSGQVM